jgi:hypothetical protein
MEPRKPEAKSKIVDEQPQTSPCDNEESESILDEKLTEDQGSSKSKPMRKSVNLNQDHLVQSHNIQSGTEGNGPQKSKDGNQAPRAEVGESSTTVPSVASDGLNIEPSVSAATSVSSSNSCPPPYTYTMRDSNLIYRGLWSWNSNCLGNCRYSWTTDPNKEISRLLRYRRNGIINGDEYFGFFEDTPEPRRWWFQCLSTTAVNNERLYFIFTGLSENDFEYVGTAVRS